jgi:hypothetical protein
MNNGSLKASMPTPPTTPVPPPVNKAQQHYNAFKAAHPGLGHLELHLYASVMQIIFQEKVIE